MNKTSLPELYITIISKIFHKATLHFNYLILFSAVFFYAFPDSDMIADPWSASVLPVDENFIPFS